MLYHSRYGKQTEVQTRRVLAQHKSLELATTSDAIPSEALQTSHVIPRVSFQHVFKDSGAGQIPWCHRSGPHRTSSQQVAESAQRLHQQMAGAHTAMAPQNIMIRAAPPPAVLQYRAPPPTITFGALEEDKKTDGVPSLPVRQIIRPQPPPIQIQPKPQQPVAFSHYNVHDFQPVMSKSMKSRRNKDPSASYKTYTCSKCKQPKNMSTGHSQVLPGAGQSVLS